MTAYNSQSSLHKILAAGTEDIATLNQRFSTVEVYNKDGGGFIFCTVNNVAVTASEQNDTYIVGPGQALQIPVDTFPAGKCVTRLYSTTACAYSITGVR